jgi:hypothetical protein
MGTLRVTQPSRPWRAQQPDGAFRAGHSCVLTGVQEGGVLKMRSGAVQFESVAISNTSATVRVAGQADRTGGGLGRRCAEWWRGKDIWRINRVQGRQHRTLFGGAQSSLLTVVCVALSSMGSDVRCMVCGAWCNVCCTRCTYV